MSLYADDSALMIAGKDHRSIAQSLSTELNSCQQWLVDNKLSLHLGKTEAILFGSKRKLKRVENVSVSYNGHTIQQSKAVKYIGVSLDECLTGEPIANSIISKSNSRLKFVYRQARFLNEKTKKTLCSALIQCHFDYACSAWYSGLSQNLKRKLQITQNKMVRFILDKHSRSHIGQDELNKISMLKVAHRVSQLKLNHAFKICNGTSPQYLGHFFSKT